MSRAKRPLVPEAAQRNLIEFFLEHECCTPKALRKWKKKFVLAKRYTYAKGVLLRWYDGVGDSETPRASQAARGQLRRDLESWRRSRERRSQRAFERSVYQGGLVNPR